MPPSRYVSSDRLLRMTVFLAVAFVVLLALAMGLQALGSPPVMRRVLLLLWLVGLPVVGWRVWKAGDDRSGH